MSSKPHIAAVFHDAGGANAIIPVIRQLLEKNIAVTAIYAGPSVRVWENAGVSIPAIKVEDSISKADAQQLLKEKGITVLLSAGGIYNRMEHTFRLAATASDLFSVSLLDSWFNYVERYSRDMEGKTEWSRPDVACAMDQSNYKGMLAAGFRSDQLIITGPPNLEWSIAQTMFEAEKKRQQWREQEGLAAQDLVITFFSDPFYWLPDGRPCTGPGGLMSPEGKSLYGYTSLTVLSAVLEDLDAAFKKQNRRCQLVLKPHPLEYVDSLCPILAAAKQSHVNVTLRTEGSAAQWIGISDAAIGMMSIALLETALADKPALSVQLGLPESGQEDPCLSNLLGYTYPIYDRDSLRSATESLACGRLDALKKHPENPLALEGSAKRVMNVLLDQNLQQRSFSHQKALS